MPDARATLIPNLETALNAVWDAELGAGARVLVVGAGVVGLLVAFVLHVQGRAVAVVDVDAARRDFAARLPWVESALHPDEVESRGFDVAFHASGHPAGLQCALDALAFEGRVVELSWYGDREVPLQLGTDFHYLRKRIVASQVSAIAPVMRAQLGYGERLALVLDLLRDPRLDALLGPELPLGKLPEFMVELYAGNPSFPLPVIDYSCTA